jgi:hypothetical protein
MATTKWMEMTSNGGDDGHNNQRDAVQRRSGTTGGNMRRCDVMRRDATRRDARGHNNQQDAGQLDKATRQQNDSGWLV